MDATSTPIDTDPLLADLTDPQREAVMHVDGPLLVLAGAGSGKTRVITRRVAHLVLRVGLAPWHILAITFTNKAAGEMKQRIGQLLSEKQTRAVTVCTFHSLCARIIREHADLAGLTPGFSIYDTADQQRAMKQALESLEISTTHFPPAKVLHAISQAKNELLSPEEFARSVGDFYSRNVAKIYKKYQDILDRNNAVDFDDLLRLTVQLLKKRPEVLDKLRGRWQYLLIDEYQDTNHAQFMIANVLAPGGGLQDNICATGDPDQSIYGWRGANIRNILEFEKHYPNASVVRLEQNYRSTPQILAVADKLIQNNRQRKHKSLWTHNPAGDPVRIVTTSDERHEAQWVMDKFRTLRDEQELSWGDMAVFYRINSLSRVMEETLRDAGIPYQIARGTAFYDRKEIKDAVAYLRAIANPADEVNLSRIINTPARGISDNTVKTLQAYGLAHNLTLKDVLKTPLAVPGLNTRAVNAVGTFANQLDRWRGVAGIVEGAADSEHVLSLRAFVEMIIRESGLHELHANDKSDPDQERLANLGELVSSAQQFEDDIDAEMSEQGEQASIAHKLDSLLERIALVSDVDSVDQNEGAVTLMTLHAAKGLEFPVVAMIGVEENLLPHHRAQESMSELEEERRLCFVGITRAMKHLFITHAKWRTVFGRTEATIASRFFGEMPRDAIELLDEASASWDRDIEPDPVESRLQRDEARRAAGEYAPGTLVRHPQFGLGRILQVQPTGTSTRARIEFNTAGIKTLVLQYANLQRIER